LITEDENTLPTSHEKITVLKGVEPNLKVLDGEIKKLARFAREQDTKAIKEKLIEIIPEYNPTTRTERKID